MTAGVEAVPTAYAAGTLVRARGREWVVLPDSTPDFLLARPLGGGSDDVAGLLPELEQVASATFPPPTVADLGDAASAGLLRTALRIGFRSSAGPFRSLASLAVEPRSYQYVPLLMALRQETVRLLIADDVGIGKTIEAGLIAAELLAQGDAGGLSVLCSPALAEQWQQELRTKFALDAELVLPSTVTRLERGLLMGESLFERHRITVVSTDFIKSPRRRDDFVRACPDLVIVDEAHTCVADGTGVGGRGRTLRYELLQRLAVDPQRHLVLVTATPHSGADAGFRNLIGLLDPSFAALDLAQTQAAAELAPYYVQRRRADIRDYLDQTTAFPRDRESREEAYQLTADYRRLLDRVLAYAREQVADAVDGSLHQRVRWWSALALLRALASSPAAAAATLRTRAASAAATSLAEADALGRATVLDLADSDAAEIADATPGADPDGSPAAPHRRRLLELARAAEALAGPKQDAKLVRLTKVVKGLLADGYDPIVFARFIDTADYVAAHLAGALGRGVQVASVTGTLPPAERVQRIAELTATDARHVLVATDCLSEGVNLQDAFAAVVHYDLPWTPSRLDQREGRVDRFGQTRDVVRAVTIYGTDTMVDGIVLDVLLRRHAAIRAATGVSVPVPDSGDSVVEALMEGLLLRGQQPEQFEFNLGLREKTEELDRAWQSAAAAEKRSRTKFAQRSIHPEAVEAEVAEIRASLGTAGDVAAFAEQALRGLGASVVGGEDGFTATTSTLPLGLRDALPARPNPLPWHADWPAPRGHAVLVRTDPQVGALARYVLDAALDRSDPGVAAGDRVAEGPIGSSAEESVAGSAQLSALPPVARRAGVMRTKAVTVRTTALLVRYRFHLSLPGRDGARTQVAEDAAVLAFTGPAHAPTWLDQAQVAALLAATPDGNIPADLARDRAGKALAEVPLLAAHLDTAADESAARLLAAHRRVRAGAGAVRRGLSVTAQHPADVLGVYLYLPVPAGTAGGGA